MRTGGLLNVLNEKHRCNDPHKTIRISTIMRVHAPRTEQAMLETLKLHELEPCSMCTERARNGGLTGWVNALWSVVQQESGHTLTRSDCEGFVYDLYVKAPVRGFFFEDTALQWLYDHGYRARLATPHEDCAYAVDIVILDKFTGAVSAGIQVKPISYQFVRAQVHALNATKNSAAGYPVFYLYYENTDAWMHAGQDVLKALWHQFQYMRYL